MKISSWEITHRQALSWTEAEAQAGAMADSKQATTAHTGHLNSPLAHRERRHMLRTARGTTDVRTSEGMGRI